MLFCINPASIFCSAVYTESLYALTAFSGMLATETGPLWQAVAAFALCASIRSNGENYVLTTDTIDAIIEYAAFLGIVNLGFLCHLAARRMVGALRVGRK
eukprot:scaffold189403_cov42-Prasinocladus_malaysianus.AAC.2